MRGVNFLGSSIRFEATYPFATESPQRLLYLGLQIGSGCLFNVENDLLWIALVILIFCESREFSLADCVALVYGCSL